MTEWAGLIVGEQAEWLYVIEMSPIRHRRLLRLSHLRGFGWLRRLAVGPVDHTVVHPK